MSSTGTIRAYLRTEFDYLLCDPYLEEGIYAHITPAFAVIKSRQILDILRRVAA
jgi:hypothetical protein